MISPFEFRANVDLLAIEFGLSIVSGRRSPQHSIDVGGTAWDPHAWGAGADTLPILDPERRGEFVARARELGLLVLWEHGSQHVQPLEWPPGPVLAAPDPAWSGMHA